MKYLNELENEELFDIDFNITAINVIVSADRSREDSCWNVCR
ncbi:hypothetical protein [Fluviispira sanaruensis]|uniref:Uncharacterized protein n=1 Tax=Fluviispira sanaruensis TaxID=2493639 RepID=A0A4P2VY46_FLUSA|nr:hypothetical protein [Fluviispira sanaruensis]BBH54605.1 hypothetical protein JCM31447_30780 [Fluviispira sanaruensis]